MAKFKNKDILVLQNEELLLGDAQEASIKYDGSDLVVNKVPYHNTEGYLATQQFVNDALLGLDWQDSVLSMTANIPDSGSEGDRYIVLSPSASTWDPDNKDASITLSNENLTATGSLTAIWRSVIADIGKFSGKWYWEITVDVDPGTSSHMIGVAHVDMTLTLYCGEDSAGVGYYDSTGNTYYNGAGTSYGDAYTAGDIIGIALDCDNDKIFFSKNGVWQDSGDPVAGTNPAQTIDGAEGWYAVYSSNRNLAEITANFGESSFSYSVPTGYSDYNNVSESYNADDIVEWETSSWTETTPSAGFTLWVENEGVYYTHSGSAWVKMGTVVDHSNLLNLDVDDHTQYLNTTRHDTTARHGSSVVDHGGIGGLGDDDHSQYLTTVRHDTTDRHGSSVVDHGQIGGLGDDDHSQYLTTVRHDTTDRHGSSVVDHGSIGGLSDDDHTQYVHISGGRALTGDWDAGANNIYASGFLGRSGANTILKRNAGDLGILINTDGQTVIDSTCFLQGDAYLRDNRRLTFGNGYDNTIVYSTTTDTLQILDGNATNNNVIAHFSSIGLSATAFYGDASNVTGIVVDHGDLTGLDDDDHTQYLHTDGRRPWDGTLTVASTGSQIQFTEDLAYIGVSSNTDLMTLSPTGVTVDGVVVGDIDHDTLTNTHNLSTDIDHANLTNTHNLTFDIDHGSITGLADDDHTQYFILTGTRSVSGDILAGTSGLDIGSVGTPFDDIYCNTLHTSAGSVYIGTVKLTDVGGILTLDSNIAVSGGIWDSDGDTGIQLEESGDDDIIRMDIAGVETVKVTANGLAIFGTSGSAARLNLVADQAEDLADYWRLLANDSGSGQTFTLDHYVTDTYINTITVYPDGEVTMPLQPSIKVEMSGNDTNWIRESDIIIPLNTIVYQDGDNFNTGTNTYTAPVGGKYIISFGIYVVSLDEGATYYRSSINTSNDSYYFHMDPNFTADLGTWTFTGSVVADMDANDTATLRLRQNGGLAQTDIMASNTWLFITKVT